MVVDDFPGTTRDTIHIPWNYKVIFYFLQNRKIIVSDTAGIVRKD